jgi:Galactose binding lectin domain
MEPGTKQTGIMVTGLFVVLFVCGLIGYIIYQTLQNLNANNSPSPSGAPGSGPSNLFPNRQCTSSPAAVYPSPTPQNFTITAPSGTTIQSVDYASFGNPYGVCGAWTDGTCQLYPDTSVQNIVSTSCVGKNTCTIPLSTQTFGPYDPSQVDNTCSQPMQLTVQYEASAAPTPAPSSH